MVPGRRRAVLLALAFAGLADFTVVEINESSGDSALWVELLAIVNAPGDSPLEVVLPSHTSRGGSPENDGG